MSDIEKVKKLREATGAGFKDCNLAIKESNGDLDKAIEILRVKGISKASKKMSRDAKEGVVVVSGDQTKTSVIEVNCETDFVARTEEFISLAKDLAMQVAAMSPEFIYPEDEGADSSSSEEVLISQSFIKDPSLTIEDMIKSMISKVGENIKVSKIIKFDLS